LSADARNGLAALARGQFMTQWNALADSASQTLLAIYRTRTLRGIALGPVGVLGEQLAVRTPFTDDEVARTLLTLSPERKLGARLYDLVFADVDPAVGALASTNDRGRSRQRRHLPRRERSEEAVRIYEWALSSSPLRPYLHPDVRDSLARGRLDEVMARREVLPALRAITLFSLWQERYANHLGSLDPSAVL
jgi:hypothetical protein